MQQAIIDTPSFAQTMTATAKMYMGKTGVVLFSVAVAVFALLNAISTFTKYGMDTMFPFKSLSSGLLYLNLTAPLSAVYLSKDLGFVWIGICIICTVSAGFAQTSRIEKARREVIVWYHVCELLFMALQHLTVY